MTAPSRALLRSRWSLARSPRPSRQRRRVFSSHSHCASLVRLLLHSRGVLPQRLNRRPPRRLLLDVVINIAENRKVPVLIGESEPQSNLSNVHVMFFDPAKSCIDSPEVTMGVILSSITVPRFEARITRIQKNRSVPIVECIHTEGADIHTEKRNREITVSTSFSLNGTV